jgi:hypothetical protein
MQELGGRNLRKADRGHVADVLTEDLVHLLVDALGLDGIRFEMRAAEHGLLPLAASGNPGRAILEHLPSGPAFEAKLTGP